MAKPLSFVGSVKEEDLPSHSPTCPVRTKGSGWCECEEGIEIAEIDISDYEWEGERRDRDLAKLATVLTHNLAVKAVKKEATLVEINEELTTTTKSPFPFTLDNLVYWVARRKDGIVIRYTLQNGSIHSQEITDTTTKTTTKTSYKEWCHHSPSPLPVFIGTNSKGKEIRLWIADVSMKDFIQNFDYVIDAGDVITTQRAEASAKWMTSKLEGDPELVNELAPYVDGSSQLPPTKILKIDWYDRKAPPLKPEFWPQLADRLEGFVGVNCVGGHGRSGTALVILMMVLNPEYSAKDAMVHLRAIHCARAIEGVDQHDYINTVAKYLGREANAKEVGKIKNFREAFLAMKHPSARPYQDRLLDEEEKK